MILFKHLTSCLSKGRSPQNDVEMRLDRRLKTLGPMKKMCNVDSINLCVKMEFYVEMVAATVMYV